jgi:hypothetical protein
VRINRYMFGTRPSLADFGWFGQLKTLATDTTPMLEMRAAAPMVEHWVRQLDDVPGLDGEWIDGVDALPKATTDILRVVGDVYLPFLEANAKAAAAGQDAFTVELAERAYTQSPFGYQVKCLAWLREELAAMDQVARDRIQPLLEDTGCCRVLTSGYCEFRPSRFNAARSGDLAVAHGLLPFGGGAAIAGHDDLGLRDDRQLLVGFVRYYGLPDLGRAADMDGRRLTDQFPRLGAAQEVCL